MADSQDSRPVPDPTVLTTEASVRLEKMIRDLIKAEINHMNELFSEKFAKIDMRFNMLDARTAEQKSDTKAALDAALAAQKEAVGSQTASFKENITKSETASNERIKGVETLLAASSSATDGKISDLKDRLIAIETGKRVSSEQTSAQHAIGIDTRGNMATVMSVIMAAIAVASIVIAIIVVIKP